MIFPRKLAYSLARGFPVKVSPISTAVGSTHSQQAQPQDASSATDPQSKGKKSPKPAVLSKSFVMNMFCGRTVTDQLLPYPRCLTAEQDENLQMMIGPTEKFFETINPAKNDAQGFVDDATMKAMAEQGAFGIQVPPEYGGIGFNNTQYARMGEILGATDLGVSITLGAHQSIGFKGIMICGTPEQKAKYLPKLASGEHVAAFALTEPTMGSDASAVRSYAAPSEDGSHYVLNGSKIWISNGGIAEIFTVFAKTPVKDESTGVVTDKVTAFIVERSFGGLTHGAPERKMGIKASNTAEVYFDNVRIPKENMLGGIGQGFKVAMEILNNGRFGMAAAMSGSMRGTIAKAVEFANNREQFGSKICKYGAIQEKLARMAILHYVTESLAFMISSNMDGGSKDYHLEAAISKIFGSEAAWTVTDEAIQVHGGMGFMSDTGLERVMRDVRIFRIFEGTNDILRLFVALTGLQYAGTHLRALQAAMSSPATNLGVLVGEGGRRAIRAMGLSSGNTALQSNAHPSLGAQAQDLSKTVELFGSACEALLIKHGRGVVDQQFLLNRIANSAIDLYTSGAVLSRASRALTEKHESAPHEEKMARVWINEACSRTRHNLKLTRSSDAHKNFADLSAISGEVCKAEGLVARRALGY